MRKVYYIYNPKTRTYDRIYPTVRQRALSILRRLFVGMGLGAGSFIILLLIFGSPSEKELRIENTRLLAQYNVLSHRLDEAMGVMQDIQQRDDNLYRVVLQADPVSDAVRKAGYGGTNRYEQLRDMANADLVINTTQKLDMLNRQLYIQSKSFDEVVDLCKNHDEMLKCIPAIMPVSNKNLKKTASGYGVRIDPIYKTAKFHAGMDFSANIGTPVYATGDGTVVKAGWETGYGNLIQVDHGFGYVTWYAHLSKYNVRPGQKVVRGEELRQQIVDFALQFEGNPYVYGGTSLTNGADCSGFVMSVFAQFGYSLPRVAADQYNQSVKKSVEDLEPGDLVFYGSGISHVALYIGNGQIIHASTSASGIKISNYDYEAPVGVGTYIEADGFFSE